MMLYCQKPESQDITASSSRSENAIRIIFITKDSKLYSLSDYLKKEPTLILNNAHDNRLLNWRGKPHLIQNLHTNQLTHASH